MNAHPLGLVLLGGLAGSLVGGAEAVLVLTRLHPAEYQAIAYAVLGYGLLGAALAVPVTGLLALAGGRVSGARAVAVVASVVAGALLAGVTRIQGRDLLGALPFSPTTSLVALGVGVALGGTWLGRHLVQKTALRALLQARVVAVAWAVLGAVSLLLAASPAPGAAADPTPGRPQDPGFERRPDVVLVVASGLPVDLSGAPALAALRAESVTFDQAIASAPTSAPSLGSIFTSVPPSRHGVVADGATLAEPLTTVAEVFRDAGYVTLGLPDDPAVTGARGFSQGFDSYAYRRDDPLLAAESSTSLALYLALAAAWQASGQPTEWYTRADVQMARATELLSANPDHRVFLFVQLRDPALGRLDAAIGDLRASLVAGGRWEEALVIVTSDHGTPSEPASLLSDAVIHVPLLVKLPDGAGAGTRVPWQVRLTDLAPTLADGAGLVPSTSWWGVTLFDDWFDEDLALLQLETAPADWAHHPGSRPAVAEATTADGHLTAVRIGGRKIRTATALGEARRECIDLASDPYEQEDRWSVDPICRRSDVTDALLSGWTGVRPRAADSQR